MGYSTEIFIPTPSQGVLCAICHDVLQDATAFNCGHTFCATCVADIHNNTFGQHHGPSYPPSHRAATCPNCRAVVSSTTPNYVVREIINGLTVRCLHGTNDDDNLSDDFVDNNKQQCKWTGCVQDLQEHDRTCKYKLIACTVEGCNHRCQRKDMLAHSSDIDVKFRHMELKYESKLKAMEDKHDAKIQSLQNDFDRELAAHERNLVKHYESKIRTLENEFDGWRIGVKDVLESHNKQLLQGMEDDKKQEAKMQSLQNDLDRELAANDRHLASHFESKILSLQLKVAEQESRIQTVEQKQKVGVFGYNNTKDGDSSS